MKYETIHRLGDLQLAILQALWRLGSANVSQVQRAVGSRLAYTTVATMLRKMEQRGLVRHREEGRRFVYDAAVGAGEVSRRMTDRLVDRLFQGSLARTVSHLLETRDIDRQELDQLERMIQDRKKRR